MWVLQASEASEFVSSFCDPSLSWADFRNQLGKFTPCFTDVVILGVAHVVSIILCLVQIALICNKRLKKFKVVGNSRKVLWSCIVAAACCVLIPLLQLNARIGQAVDKSTRQVPPHEYAELLVAALTWALLTAVLVLELDGLTWPHRVSIRFAVSLSAASELVKLRFLLEADQLHNYFFWLYTAYVGFQMYLALVSLICRFDKRDLVPADPDGYLPLVDEQNGEAEHPDLQASPRPVCPEATAGLFSTLTFSWMSPTVSTGAKRPLTLSDLWNLPPKDQVRSVSNTFSGYWAQQMRTKSPNLFLVCWKTTRGLWLTAAPFKFTNDICQFAGPYFLGKLLASVSNGEPLSVGYMYAVCMFAGTMLGVLCDNQHFQRVMRAGFRLKAALVAEVHHKVFNLTPAARAKFTSGRIFNLVSSDAETVQSLCQGMFGFISSPLRIIISMTLLVYQLGPSAFMAVLCIGAIVPVNMMIMAQVARVLRQALAFTDERTKLEGELVAGVEVVKCSAWEKPFKERIDAARAKELGRLLLVNLLQGGTTFLIASIPTIVPVATFAVYLLMGRQLTAATAFTALSLFNVLRFPLFQLPMLVTQYTQARVCLGRLREFLAADELPDDKVLPAARTGESAVHIEGDYSWDTRLAPTLTNIKLDVKAGTVLAVVGSTGSGKSSLLSAILGYMQKVYGPPVQVRGRTAYVPQAAFITNATVRENILFGLPYDAERYEAAVAAACLNTDFEQLPGGDQTELGDRGTNVSGGQKQRISIARALYSNADVYLLDDPLSALDSKVGRQVFDHAIKECLANAGKTVVLATNQLQFVNRVDQVVYLQHGTVAEMGTYEELMAANKGFAALMREALASMEDDGQESNASGGQPDGEHQPSAALAVLAPAALMAPATEVAAGAKLTEQEKSATGGLSWTVVGTYLLAMGGLFPPLRLAFGFVTQETLRVGTNVWLSVWTDDLDQQDPTSRSHGAMYYLNMYALISGLQLVMQLINTLDVARYGLAAGRRMHARMLTSLLKAPMSFFHTTPLGRIINRLTKDTTDIDRNLAGSTAMSVRAFLQLISTVALIGVTAPFALPFLVIVVMLFWALYQYYQASMRQIKRLDATSRSPVLSSINDAIAGCPTIRAFGTQRKLIAKHALLVDDNVIMSLVNASLNRWLSIRLESLGALATLAAAVVAVEQKGQTGQMGLVLSFALQITQITNMTLRLASVAENAFNAVERVAEYSDLPEEAPAERPDGPPPAWPDRGTVEFKEVKMRYRPGLPLVLKGISFRIESCEKVGIVGRTGAGKSSLIGCMFRLSEVESGAVYIDDINIARVGLTQLRSRLAIIPQVPVLFTGSISLNLSPFGLHSDAEMWNALRRANLALAVEGWPAGLDTQLTEGGAPLSAGQKQLLALARAVLNPSKVLVLDEATANVDVETDGLIQKTLREQFSDRTIIAIAHRLHTIMDGDKVLVLDHGNVAEFGPPAQLLGNPNGIFSSMVDDTGEASARFLRSVAMGHASLAAHYAEQAAVALSALSAALPVQPAASLSAGGVGASAPNVLDTAVTLVSMAKATTKGLQTALHDLQRRLEEEDVHPPEQAELDVIGTQLAALHGAEGNSLATLHQAMEQAVTLVNDLATLARQAHTLLEPTSQSLASAPTPILSAHSEPVNIVINGGSTPTLDPSMPPTASASAGSAPELFPRRSLSRSSDPTDLARLAPAEAKMAAARQLASALGRTTLTRSQHAEGGNSGN